MLDQNKKELESSVRTVEDNNNAYKEVNICKKIKEKELEANQKKQDRLKEKLIDFYKNNDDQDSTIEPSAKHWLDHYKKLKEEFEIVKGNLQLQECINQDVFEKFYEKSLNMSKCILCLRDFDQKRCDQVKENVVFKKMNDKIEEFKNNESRKLDNLRNEISCIKQYKTYLKELVVIEEHIDLYQGKLSGLSEKERASWRALEDSKIEKQKKSEKVDFINRLAGF